VFLGKAYLSAGDGDDSAKAFARAIALTEKAKQPDPNLYSSYGEALTRATGTVPPEARAAFARALMLNPKDQAARYYLGMAFMAQGENAKAIAMWQNLIADAPPNAPWRQELVDRIAQLTASSGAPPPDIGAMVAGLAERLKTNPNDPQGWQRLIRAYAVLGDKAKASAALADARHAMAGKSAVLSALEAEKTSLGL
jgi:cytochrome c-type biogenesis protein CcmH